MSLDKPRIIKLSDSSRMFTPKKERNTMNNPFVERAQEPGSKKVKKVSGEMVIEEQKKSRNTNDRH